MDFSRFSFSFSSSVQLLDCVRGCGRCLWVGFCDGGESGMVIGEGRGGSGGFV